MHFERKKKHSQTRSTLGSVYWTRKAVCSFGWYIFIYIPVWKRISRCIFLCFVSFLKNVGGKSACRTWLEKTASALQLVQMQLHTNRLLNSNINQSGIVWRLAFRTCLQICFTFHFAHSGTDGLADVFSNLILTLEIGLYVSLFIHANPINKWMAPRLVERGNNWIEMACFERFRENVRHKMNRNLLWEILRTFIGDFL